jgi:hypothetical protein
VLPERLPFFSTDSSSSSNCSAASVVGNKSAASSSSSSTAAPAREQRRRLHLYNSDAESHLAFKVRLKRWREKETEPLIARERERGGRREKDVLSSFQEKEKELFPSTSDGHRR